MTAEHEDAFPDNRPVGKPNWLVRRPALSAFSVTFALAFIVYAASAPPHLTPGMGGIYSTAAWRFGVPHPPGFPGWVLYAHLFSVLVPFGNVAWRVALSSAFAGALGAGFIASAICGTGGAFFNGMKTSRRLPTSQEQLIRVICGFTGACAFAFSDPFWRLAIAPEPHVFGLFLFCSSCFWLQKWFFAEPGSRPLLFATVSYALAVMNSPHLFVATPGLLGIICLRSKNLGRNLSFFVAALLLATVFFNPEGSPLAGQIVRLSQLQALRSTYLACGFAAALLFCLLAVCTRTLLGEWSKAILVLLCFLLPFAMHFQSAITSMTNPPVNWAYPRSIEGFDHLISRGHYSQVSPVTDLGTYGEQIKSSVSVFFKGYGVLFGAPALLCFTGLLKLSGPIRSWLLCLSLPFVCLTFLLLALANPPVSCEAINLNFASPGYILISFWTGCGLMFLAWWVNRPGGLVARLLAS